MTTSDEDNWYSNDAATFGDRVAAAREALGMEQKDLARNLGVKVKTLAGWENDTAEPRANRLQMLAGLLNVSIKWLLTGEGEGPGQPDTLTDPDLTELMAEMRNLRGEMTRAAERMGRLEKRLKAVMAA